MMREGGRGGDGTGSGNWKQEVRLRITEEAEGNHQSVPSYYRRFDAFDNEDHPSIFRLPNHAAVGVDATGPHMPRPSPELAGSTSIGAVTCKHASRSGGRATNRDIVVAAVGPYHQQGSPGAPPPLITDAKKCGIVQFLARQPFGLDIDGFLGWAETNEDRTRKCYERDSSITTMSTCELARMLLLDGCLLLFAVFLLRASVSEDQGPARLAREHKEFSYLSADISLHMRQTKLDLLMLDNQIPFFVLAELHERLKGTLFQNINHSIRELALSCFDDIHPSGIKCCWEQEETSGGGATEQGANGRLPQQEQAVVHHLLHLFHLSRVPRGKHRVGFASILPREPESHLPSATELEESLTSFRRTSPAAGGYSLDITFRTTMLGMRGVMSIPALCIHDYSERVFRSLIAFEQNHLRCGLGVTAYSICMARLLQSEADVRVLRKRGVLVHTQKSDKEIVDFFRGLRDEYGDTLMPNDLLSVCRNVTAHRRSRARGVMKGFLLQCFPRQTVTFFVIFGAIISIATLVNTVHSMYRYYHPYKGTSPSYNYVP